MAEVAAADVAVGLVAHHAVAHVAGHADEGFFQWTVEARPAGAALKLGRAVEKRSVTTDAEVDPIIVVVPVFIPKGLLGALLTGGDRKGVGLCSV